MFSKFLDIIQGVFKRPRVGLRSTITMLGIIVSVAAYYYIIDIYDPESNILTRFRVLSRNYTFFSGSPGGFYTRIGTNLENITKDRESRILIQNKKTAGGSENAIKVLTTPMSLGLIQEDTLREGDFIKKQLRYITPIYLERMHVLYRVDSAKELAQLSGDSPLRLSAGTNLEVLKFFARSKINAGPVGSGTRVLTSYILSEINTQLRGHKNIKLTQQIFGHPTAEAYDKLLKDNEDEKIDIVFTIAGAPLPEVLKLLENEKHKIRLLSIDPSFVAKINKSYGANLRATDFKGIYSLSNQPDVATTGSYAFLVAHRDVPNYDILKILEILYQSRDKIRLDMGLKPDSHFQLKEFDFFGSFQAEHQESQIKTLRNILFFLVSVTVSAVGVITFLVWIVSSIKQGAYFKEINQICTSVFTKEPKLKPHNSVFWIPQIEGNQSMAISVLVTGLRDAHFLQSIIFHDYRTGVIMDQHHRNLFDNLNRIISKMSDQLDRRINEALDGGLKKLTRVDLRAFYTAGFLKENAYRTLLASHFEREKKSKQHSNSLK